MTKPDPTASLPLTRGQALHQAARLKREGWTWTAISLAMGEYHGHRLSADTWANGVYRHPTLDAPKREMTPAKLAALQGMQAGRRSRGSSKGTTEPVECPVCLRPGCTVKHRDCSPKNSPRGPVIECAQCGTQLRHAVPDGLCGFCRFEPDVNEPLGTTPTPMKGRP
jgi:hypothetical protein